MKLYLLILRSGPGEGSTALSIPTDGLALVRVWYRMHSVQDVHAQPGCVRLETAVISLAQADHEKKQEGNSHVLVGKKVGQDCSSLALTQEIRMLRLWHERCTLLYRLNIEDKIISYFLCDNIFLSILFYGQAKPSPSANSAGWLS